MKKYLKGKNVLAAILCATMMLGIVPFTVFAANTDENLYTKKQIFFRENLQSCKKGCVILDKIMPCV